MTQQEFNRIVIHGSAEEVNKAILENPDLAAKCAKQIEMDVKDSPLIMDEMDYQRLVDRGLEEVEEYNYMSDV